MAVSVRFSGRMVFMGLEHVSQTSEAGDLFARKP